MNQFFHGKTKYITLGAVGLVALLAFLAKRKQPTTGQLVTDGSIPYASPAGGGSGGLNASDVQAAIADYAAKDQESTQSMITTLTTGFTDALNKQMEATNKAFEQQNQQIQNTNKQYLDSLHATENNFSSMFGGILNRLTGMEEQHLLQQHAVTQNQQSQAYVPSTPLVITNPSAAAASQQTAQTYTDWFNSANPHIVQPGTPGFNDWVNKTGAYAPEVPKDPPAATTKK